MSGKFFFSAVEDEKLVKCVAAFPCLFDSDDRGYKDRYIRENSWAQISGNVQRSVEECKKRWRNIKDTYFKLKRNTYRNGLPRRSKSKWPLLEQLTFLDSIAIKRRRLTNDETIIYEDNDSNDGNNSSPDDSNDCTTLDPLRTSLAKRPPSVSSSVDPKKRKTDNTNSLNETAELGSELSETDNIENINWKNDDDDPLLLFFKSMAMTVKTFTPLLIPEVKSRIFNIVNEFEIRYLQSKHSSSVVLSSTEDSHPEKSITVPPINIETKYSLSSSFHHST